MVFNSIKDGLKELVGRIVVIYNTSTGESVRSQVTETVRPKSKADGKMTDAPHEEDMLHGDAEGEIGDAEGVGDVER